MKRLPIIRHIRYWWHGYRMRQWVWWWDQAGIGGGWPNPSDLEHLDRIWRGEA